jgi:hypothetical protein
MLVATESIEAGAEIRINYEDGGEISGDNGGSYWKDAPPIETSTWRLTRVPPPPPSLDEPVYNRLEELKAAAAAQQERALTLTFRRT